MMTNLFFDHNATTPIRPNALALAASVMGEVGNAASVHSFGRAANKHVETARRQIAEILDVSPQQIIFNSGASEGNNTILKGFSGQRILISAIEHPSIIECGVAAEKIPVTEDGVIDVVAFQDLLNHPTPPALVSVMLVNNETGVIQPVAEIARMAKAVGAMVHCDAVQAYGRIPFTRESLGVDFLTISSHKIGGTHGVGALIGAAGLQVPRLIEGGGQERRQRGGTVNVAGISAFGVAAVEACASLDSYQNLSVWRDRIELHVQQSSNRVRILGQHSPRVANTSMIVVTSASSETLLMAFDLEGIALSAGSACSSGSTKMSYTLTAMGIEPSPQLASLRMSLGYTTSEKDVEHFIKVWDKLSARLFKD
ncbi:MAG: cysteine desulfurase [Alphaproteobacteria bacterium]|nr:cysteine desulfurase [Alphaproteobacteria bacterium]